MTRRRAPRRRLGRGVATCLVAASVSTVAYAEPAGGPTQFFQSFQHSSVGLHYPVTRPISAANQSNTACLTARDGQPHRVLPQCSATSDVDGSGVLRLTSASPNRVGAVFAAQSQPFDEGIDATFTSYQYASAVNAGKPGNGIAFAIAAADPNSTSTSVQVGPGGGSLGYAASVQPLKPGLSKAYLGIGLDVTGTFPTAASQGERCGAWPAFRDAQPGLVVVRGPGDGTRGYCLERTSYHQGAAPVAMRGPDSSASADGDRSASAVPVEVVINPHDSTVTTASGWASRPHSYLVVVTPLTGSPVILEGSLPHVYPANLYPEGWLDADGQPQRIVIGVSASTGTSTDIHEIDNLRINVLPVGTGAGGRPGR